MTRLARRRLRAAAILAFCVAGPAALSPMQDAFAAGIQRLTPAAVETKLRGAQLARWKSLDKAQQAATVQILSDIAFGQPSEALRLEAKYPQLDVTLDRSEAPQREQTTISTVSRTSWVRQNWTIFGITYTEVTTTMGYTTSGGTVIGVNRCYGTYVNYVPLRSISSDSWYTLGNGLADCWTEWTLGRPLQPTVTGIQGLRVNGWGTILKTWYV